MVGMGIMVEICTSTYPSPYPIEKVGPHTHTWSMRGFPVKTRTGSGNTHENEFICHLYHQVTGIIRGGKTGWAQRASPSARAKRNGLG